MDRHEDGCHGDRAQGGKEQYHDTAGSIAIALKKHN